MIVYPNCKINLGLNVTERRPDGYHNLETIFLPVALCDELEIAVSDRFSFVQEGIALDNTPEDNLCVKAYRMMQERYPEVGPVAMRLKKNIPFGAGLGGGSADAAFVLTLIRELFHLEATDRELEQTAAKIGADCAFFVRNQPAYATGIGDQLEPIGLDLSNYHLVLLKPTDHVATREAYGGIRPQPSQWDLRELTRRPIEEWKHYIKNDFESTVFPHHPRIAYLKDWLYSEGALYAAMSGSGAAVFGLFDLKAEPDFGALPDEEILIR